MGGPLGMYQAAQSQPIPQAQPTPDQMDVYNRNAPYVAQGAGNFNTQLPPLQEQMFQNWVAKNKVPFDPSGGVQDYDMRGFYQGLVSGHPMAATAINPNDSQIHYPDFWKTPFHESFSNESQWAGPNAPKWNNKDQLVTPDGRVVYDERKKK